MMNKCIQIIYRRGDFTFVLKRQKIVKIAKKILLQNKQNFDEENFMDIIGKFKNGTIIISNLKVEDGEYKYHFSFDVSITHYDAFFKYNFSETVYYSLYDFIDGKQKSLMDENCADNHLEMTKDYFAIHMNHEGFNTNIKLDFDKFEDQDTLYKFLIEFKAYCELLRQS